MSWRSGLPTKLPLAEQDPKWQVLLNPVTPRRKPPPVGPRGEEEEEVVAAAEVRRDRRWLCVLQAETPAREREEGAIVPMHLGRGWREGCFQTDTRRGLMATDDKKPHASLTLRRISSKRSGRF